MFFRVSHNFVSFFLYFSSKNIYKTYIVENRKKEAKIWDTQKNIVAEEKLAQKKEELENETKKNNQIIK